MIIQEQVTSFETTKLALEKGLKLEGNGCDSRFYVLKYYPKGRRSKEYFEGELSEDALDESCCDNHPVKYEDRLYAPTQSQLQTWLREKCNIDVEPVVYTRPHYCCSIVLETGSVVDVINPQPFDEEHIYAFETFNKALEQGLIISLKLIEHEK